VLENGEVFYGRIDHLGTDYPVLRGPSTVREERDPRTGSVRYVVAPREEEAWGAGHIIFPAASIACIE
jgi:hypothetical protein